MHSIFSLTLLAALASAAPSVLVKRQGITSNEVANGDCKAVSFIFARGSTEGGNMGAVVGGPLCRALKDAMNGDVACQGVGGDYRAQIAPNLLAAGTDEASINAGIDTFNQAAQNCPDALIVFGGYSQGSAVMLNAVPQLDAAVADKVVAGLFYGYTRNEQNNGELPGFPPEDLEVFCRQDDGVCDGNLRVTAGHLAYGRDGSIGQGADFLVGRVGAVSAGGAGGVGGADGAGDAADAGESGGAEDAGEAGGAEDAGDAGDAEDAADARGAEDAAEAGVVGDGAVACGGAAVSGPAHVPAASAAPSAASSAVTSTAFVPVPAPAAAHAPAPTAAETDAQIGGGADGGRLRGLLSRLGNN